MAECSFKGCGRPTVARGYCAGHFQQKRRAEAAGEPDRPLRPLLGPRGQVGPEPLVRYCVRITEGARTKAKADPRGASEAVERWAKDREEDKR